MPILTPIMSLFSEAINIDNVNHCVDIYLMNDGSYLLNKGLQPLIQFDNAADVCKYLDNNYIHARYDNHGNKCIHGIYSNVERAFDHFSESKFVSDYKKLRFLHAEKQYNQIVEMIKSYFAEKNINTFKQCFIADELLNKVDQVMNYTLGTYDDLNEYADEDSLIISIIKADLNHGEDVKYILDKACERHNYYACN